MDKIKTFILGNREPAYTNKLPNQLMLTCRVVVGGYLLYLAKGLVQDYSKTTSSTMSIVMIVAIVAFSVFGFLFLYDSIRNYIIGRYAGGKLDLGEDPNNFLDGKNEDDYDDVVTEDEALEEYASEEANIQDSKDEIE